MRFRDRTWLVNLMTVVALAAAALLSGGVIRAGLLLLEYDPDLASDAGSLSAVVLFVLLLIGYYLYDIFPWPRDGATDQSR